jgi:hypothetical protein
MLLKDSHSGGAIQIFAPKDYKKAEVYDASTQRQQVGHYSLTHSLARRACIFDWVTQQV